MISSKEARVYEIVKQKVAGKPNMKRKKDGTLDMRYNENIKYFCEEYKFRMLLENRKHNEIFHENHIEYRREIVDLSEKQLMEFSQKN